MNGLNSIQNTSSFILKPDRKFVSQIKGLWAMAEVTKNATAVTIFGKVKMDSDGEFYLQAPKGDSSKVVLTGVEAPFSLKLRLATRKDIEDKPDLDEKVRKKILNMQPNLNIQPKQPSQPKNKEASLDRPLTNSKRRVKCGGYKVHTRSGNRKFK